MFFNLAVLWLPLISFSQCQETFNIDLKFPIILQPISTDLIERQQSSELPIFTSIVATNVQNKNKYSN